MNIARHSCSTDLSCSRNPSWSEEEYLELSNFLSQERGFSFSFYKPAYIARRLMARLNNTQAKSLGEYLGRIKKDPEELNLLYNSLTINVSSFFRNREVFESIKTLILPDILKKRRKSTEKTLRVWSMGCSTGEEPYSLNMLLKKSLALRLKGIKVEILATDIDDAVLTEAKKGVYSADNISSEEMPIARASFEKRGRHYHVRPRYREDITFLKQDIFEFKPMETKFDMILCRNVMIYFTKKVHLKIYRYLADHLNEEGVLVLGKAEVMLYPKEAIFENIDVENRIYKKAETAERVE